MESLRDKVVVVTGASRGLGRTLVETFARRGARVAFCARTRESLADLEADLARRGVEALADACDLRRYDAAARFARTVIERFGRIDVLINNASILGLRVPLADYPPDTWADVLATNLTGPFHLTREVVPVMRRQRSGSIVSVSSGVGNTARRDWGAYLVSKWGLEGFSLSLAEELAGTGVRVNIVDPGAMRTTMRAAAYPQEDPRTLRSPADVVDVFLYLASDASADVTARRFRAQEFRADAT